MARGLPAWSAVRAVRQSAGRGRFGRSFVSDEGGLWLSAILPAGGSPARWAGFSLVTGCHLLRALQQLGVPQARLRWPNDLMSGPKKLAGILIEQDARESLIVGVGMNVFNTPWAVDPTLRETTTRLADVLARPPGIEEVAVRVLDAIADAHAALLSGGLAPAIDELNAHWSDRRAVRLSLQDGSEIRGAFAGLDPQGNLRVIDPANNEKVIDHLFVKRLIEANNCSGVDGGGAPSPHL